MRYPEAESLTVYDEDADGTPLDTYRAGGAVVRFPRGASVGQVVAAAVAAAVERCAVVAETRFRPADAWSRPTVFGGEGVVASAVYYRDAELHDAGRQIAAAIRQTP